MKKLFLASLALLISTAACADTDVYVVNKTKSPMVIQLIPGGSPFMMGIPLLQPGERAKTYGFNRNVGVKSGQTYTFKAKLTGPGLPTGNDTLYLLQRIKGHSVAGSDIWLSMATQNNLNNPKWYASGSPVAGFNAKVGAKSFAISARWIFTGASDDIEYTISETGTTTPKNELNLVQYNIQQRPYSSELGLVLAGLSAGRSSDTDRNIVTKLAPSIKAFDPNVDVITINEAFAKSIRPALKKNMKENGFIYQTNVLNANASEAWSGGVMVFSKYPISKTKEYKYNAWAAADKSSAKGILYVQINKNGKLYNIFATHTNASYSFGKNTRLPLDDVGRGARAKQFVELKNFINAQRIPSNQPVIIVGDLNVDMISEKGKNGDEYANMLRTLNASHPQVVGHKFTLDKDSNTYVDPEDGPKQYLDYALYSNAHQKPIKSSNQPLCLKQGGKNVCSKAGGKDISDHYPIRAKFTFPN